MQTKEPIYTIHADGKKYIFIWLKDASTGKSAIGKSMSRAKLLDELMPRLSRNLFEQLMSWTETYTWSVLTAAANSMKDNDSTNKLDIDWDQFNDEGMEIAREMKKKLGDKVTVQYLKSKLDPSGDTIPIVIG